MRAGAWAPEVEKVVLVRAELLREGLVGSLSLWERLS